MPLSIAAIYSTHLQEPPLSLGGFKAWITGNLVHQRADELHNTPGGGIGALLWTSASRVEVGVNV